MQEIKVSYYRTQYPYTESVHDQGFGQSGVCRHFTKNEDTWYKVLGHYDAEYDATGRVIQLVVEWMTPYIN